MITETTGNLLHSQCDALVNPINIVGAMGKGLALQFKHAYPKNYIAYMKACQARQLSTGKMFVSKHHDSLSPRYIINFPTKHHWGNDSKIEYIRDGLYDLRRVLDEYTIPSVAIPALGCGYGGLEWHEVHPLITQTFEDLPHVVVELYPPAR